MHSKICASFFFLLPFHFTVYTTKSMSIKKICSCFLYSLSITHLIFLYRRHLKIRDMLSVLFALPPMPLEPAKRVQSHSSCSGGWSGANSIYCCVLTIYSKSFSPSIYWKLFITWERKLYSATFAWC